MSRHGCEAIVEFCAVLSIRRAHRMKNERFNEADHLELTAGYKGKITRREGGTLNLKTILAQFCTRYYKYKRC